MLRPLRVRGYHAVGIGLAVTVTYRHRAVRTDTVNIGRDDMADVCLRDVAAAIESAPPRCLDESFALRHLGPQRCLEPVQGRRPGGFEVLKARIPLFTGTPSIW